MSTSTKYASNDENKKPDVLHSQKGGAEKASGLLLPPRRTTLSDISNTVGVVTREAAKKQAAGIVASKLPSRVRLSSNNASKAASAAQTSTASAAVSEHSSSSFSSRMALAMTPEEPAVVQDVFSEARRAIETIDAADKSNPQAVTEYVNDIFQYLKELEKREATPSNFMAAQNDINEKMRAILIDWLVEVHLKFKLVPDTLYLTVNLIDRYLAQKIVTRQRLQLVGVTAMLCASKYEEIYAPEVRDFVYISDKAYTREEILEMESSMLGALGFNLSVPHGLIFMNRLFKVAAVEKREIQELAHYLLELTLQDYKFLKYLPSVVASSALYLALRFSKHSTWTPVLQYYTSYKESEMRTCAKEMEDVAKMAPSRSLTAVYKKYCSPKFLEVAKHLVFDS